MKKASYDRALTHVKGIKSFYNHLFIYIVFLILWAVFAVKIFRIIGSEIKFLDGGFFDWVNVNLWLNPLIWGIIVLIHGLYAFRYKVKFFKDWEDRKIQEFMMEDSLKENNHYE